MGEKIKDQFKNFTAQDLTRMIFSIILAITGYLLANAYQDMKGATVLQNKSIAAQSETIASLAKVTDNLDKTIIALKLGLESNGKEHEMFRHEDELLSERIEILLTSLASLEIRVEKIDTKQAIYHKQEDD